MLQFNWSAGTKSLWVGMENNWAAGPIQIGTLEI